MSYASAVDHLYALGHELAPTPGVPRRKFDLAHMRVLDHALGEPHRAFPAILIAGTNGKGSTASTLASILTAAGYRTGLYTSPHLIRVNERIQIDGREIPDDDFARLYFRVDDTAHRLVAEGTLPHTPSFFEVLTALAFVYFAEQKIDIAVLEVGLGGRLDATNIVEPILSILTDIALDHQEYLGETIAAITREKAGILRHNGILVTLPQHPEANQAIGEAAQSLDLRAISATPFLPPTNPGIAVAPHPDTPLPRNRYDVVLDGEALHVDSPLNGQHQQRNIALAIAAAHALRNIPSRKSATTVTEGSPAISNKSSSKLSFDSTPSGPKGSAIVSDKSNQSCYNIPTAAIEQGIRNTRWPARLEVIASTSGPALILDVAHNPAGAWTLRAAIAQLPAAQPRTLIFSCLRDKDLREMTQILLPLFDRTSGDPDRSRDHVLFAPIHNPRAASLEELLAAAAALDIPAIAAPTLADALTQARDVTPPDGIILATGSIYLVGELRKLAGESAGTR